MCCFVAPAAAAIVTTAVKKKVPAKYQIDKLLLMLWGGVLMLLVDHIATGEVIFSFPFFTRSWMAIWPEILKVGVPMTIVIFAAWVAMVADSLYVERKRQVVAKV